MHYKIGIFGSPLAELSPEISAKLQRLGELLAQSHCIVITGACLGIPYLVVQAAARQGAETWGFSPVTNKEEQQKLTPEQDLSLYSKIVYLATDWPFVEQNRVGRKYRNVISTATCDAGIVISGRWGTLNECTNLIDMGKTVGVLTDTGGMADELPMLSQKIKKEGAGTLLFGSDPEQLLEKIFVELSSKT